MVWWFQQYIFLYIPHVLRAPVSSLSFFPDILYLCEPEDSQKSSPAVRSPVRLVWKAVFSQMLDGPVRCWQWENLISNDSLPILRSTVGSKVIAILIMKMWERLPLQFSNRTVATTDWGSPKLNSVSETKDIDQLFPKSMIKRPPQVAAPLTQEGGGGEGAVNLYVIGDGWFKKCRCIFLFVDVYLSGQ